MTATDGGMVVVGRISSVFGLAGAVRVHSATDPAGNIAGYRPWFLNGGEGWRESSPREVKVHGRGLLASFDGVADRDAAAALVGAEIAVPRSCLPATGADEHYWVDLIGLRVCTVGGRDLGVVRDLMETGANDVLVVAGERQRLIPYLPGQVVTAVQLEKGRIEVDWDPDF